MALTLHSVSTPHPSIKELENISTKKTVCTDATRRVPIVLKSSNEAKIYFEKKALTKLSKRVDFKKEKFRVFGVFRGK